MKKVHVYIAAASVALLFWGCPSKQENTSNAAATPGVQSAQVPSDYSVRTKRPASAQKAPLFSAKTIDGSTINLADLKGKVVILDFWATWCPPCKAEIPDFIALQKEYAGKNFVMIGAAVDDPGKVKKFAKANSMNYPIFIVDQSVADNYGGIRGIPTTFIIDREGYIVRDPYVGYRPKEVFEQDIKDLM